MFMIEYNGNGLMEEMMKEELMDGGTMVNHDTWWGWNHQDEWDEAATWEHQEPKIRTILEETHSLTTHKNYAEFLYYNFNLLNTLGRSLIYRWRSLGEQAKGVRWEKGKKWAALGFD